MLRLIFFLALLGSLYLIYGDYFGGRERTVKPLAQPTPVATREGSGRLGGGLNPFVSEADHGSAPQPYRVPEIPKSGGSR